MNDRTFEALPRKYRVDIKWKHGFEHGYEQKLTLKQLEREQERLATYNWIEEVVFQDLTDSDKDS